MKKMLAALGLALGAAPLALAASEPPAMMETTAAPATKYLCQKKDASGYWCTVYVCYCYEDACAWYNRQPSNARIVAQK